METEVNFAKQLYEDLGIISFKIPIWGYNKQLSEITRLFTWELGSSGKLQ